MSAIVWCLCVCVCLIRQPLKKGVETVWKLCKSTSGIIIDFFICAHAVGLNIDNCHNISRVFAQIVRVCYPIGRCLQIGVNSRFKKRFLLLFALLGRRFECVSWGGEGAKKTSPRPLHTPKTITTREREIGKGGEGGGGQTQTDRQTDRQT